MPTLLYIDDDAALARLVDRGLTRLGFKVVHAAERRGRARARCSRAASTSSRSISTCRASTAWRRWSGFSRSRMRRRWCSSPRRRIPAIAVTALKAGAADYLVKDVQGDFIPLLHVAVDGAIRQAMRSQGPRRGRGRGPRLARPLRRARRRARGAAARGQPPRRQLACRSSPRCCICRPIRATRTTSRRR